MPIISDYELEKLQECLSMVDKELDYINDLEDMNEYINDPEVTIRVVECLQLVDAALAETEAEENYLYEDVWEEDDIPFETD